MWSSLHWPILLLFYALFVQWSPLEPFWLTMTSLTESFSCCNTLQCMKIYKNEREKSQWKILVVLPLVWQAHSKLFPLLPSLGHVFWHTHSKIEKKSDPIQLVDLCPVFKWFRCQMLVWKQDWKKLVYGPKCLVGQVTWLYHLNTRHPYCSVFIWIQYSGVRYSDGYCLVTI